jgi:hypothetical protein
MHPFDAFNYGKLYSIPILVRQNESFVLDHFGDFVDTRFKKLVLSSPDCAVELVKKYLKYSNCEVVDEETAAPTNKFRAWLQGGY